MKILILSFLMATTIFSVTNAGNPQTTNYPRHEIAQSLPPLNIGLIFFNDRDCTKTMGEFKNLATQNGHNVTEVTQVKNKNVDKKLPDTLSMMLEKNDVIFIFGGTGFAPDDDAVVDLTKSYNHMPIPAYQHIFYARTLNENPVAPISPENLALLTRATAFFTADGKILVLSPGSPQAGEISLNIMLPALKILCYQRHKKSLETPKEKEAYRVISTA